MPYEVDDLFPVEFRFDYHAKSKNGEHDGDGEVVLASMEKCALTYFMKRCDSDHMVLHYDVETILVYFLRKYSGKEVTFKFYHEEVPPWGRRVDHEVRRPFELKSCGVDLHFEDN